MGFLDKAKAAASTAKSAAVAAKDELEKSGLIDQLKGKDGNGPEATGSEPERDTTGEMLDSIRRGAVDPRMIIARGEVAAIAGHDVAEGQLHFNGDMVYLVFDAPKERYTVHVMHHMDDEYPWDGREQYDNWRDVMMATEDAPAIGDASFRQPDSVWTLVGDKVLFVEATGDKLTAEAKAVRAEQLARTVVGNLQRLS